MKVKVFIPGTDIIKKAHKNQDYDIVVNGFNQTERIRYSKELNGETCRLKTLAECSENTAKTYICAFDTDNYGIIKHSAGVFDCGKLLGISDMTVAYSGSPYMPGAHGKLYDTKSGKIAVAIGDDLFRYELFKSFAVCGAEAPERFDVSEGCLVCAGCGGSGIRMPLGRGALAAMRYITLCEPKKIFSFRLEPQALDELADIAEAYLITKLERGFSTLDFYKSLLLL